MRKYPRAMYVSSTSELKIYTVSINGYHENMSAESFIRLNRDVPFDLASHGRPDYGIDPYNFAYDVDRKIAYLSSVYEYTAGMEITDPILLYDFYDKIGYERKTKKFHGKTMRKMILEKMAAERELRDNNSEKG